MAQAETRVFGLDLLRTLAIVLVVFTHSSSILSPGLYKASVYTGCLGVELFFVLSGFLIGTILLKINARAAPLQFKDVKTFWIRRWFRTLPNYYLMFFVYAVIFYVSHHVNVFAHIKYWSYLVFLQNAVSYQPNDFFPVAWSLSIEEWFYLVFPLLLLLISKILKGHKARSFVTVVLGIIIIELLIRIAASLLLNNFWDEGFRKLMPLRLDSIDIGVLAACVKFYRPGFWGSRANELFVAGLFILAMLSVYLYLNYINFSDPVHSDHGIKTGAFLDTVFFTLASFSIALMIPRLYGLKMKPGLFTRAATVVSKISYSMYLTHFLVMLVFLHVFKQPASVWYANVALFAGVWAATILISWVQYYYFEVRVTSMRNKYSRVQAAIKI